MSRRGESITGAGALTAICAALALLVQVLLPSGAMATAARDGGALIQICSAGAPKGLAQHGPAKGFAGLKCAECVMASVAAVAPPSPPVPARLAAAVRFKPPVARVLAHAPRGPPGVREQS